MRLFGLIGFPLSHSFSANYFSRKFVKEQISEVEYRHFPLSSISLLTELIEKQPDLQGFNITIPYKIEVLPFLNEISEEAAAIGAVNCVRITRMTGKIILKGYNTDVYGFRESLIPLLKPHHTHALVLGTGGASKAVCYTLKELGIGYSLVSRNGLNERNLTYSSLTKKDIDTSLLIINTTPVGMHPDTTACPAIPYQFLSSGHLLFDLIYNPAETTFLRMGKKYGATTNNGLQMLELQAEKSWEIWNG